MSIQINAGDTCSVVLRLKSSGTQLALADIATLRFTLRDVRTGGVINSRTNQDVKNVNDVVVTADGTVTWSVRPEDTIVVDARLKTETHRLLVVCTYAGGVGSGEIDLVINNTARLR